MERGYLSEAFVSFQGEGQHVGRRQLFIRFAGCPLRCRYCDTPDSLVHTEQFVVHAATPYSLPNPVSLFDVRRAIGVLLETETAVDGVSLTGGEPLAQRPFLATLLREVDLPRPRLLETAGTLPEEMAEVVGDLDVVSMDLKLPSNTGETAFWDEHRRFLRVAGGKAYVKILVDGSTSNSDLDAAAALVAAESPSTPVYLQPVTPRKEGELLEFSRMSELFGRARRLLGDVRVVPQTHKMLDYR